MCRLYSVSDNDFIKIVESSFYIKDVLIKEDLLEEVCSICNIGSIWNGKRLVLQMDHINGDNSDNRLSNLRLLCPNCHSQTETYGGKKRSVSSVG